MTSPDGAPLTLHASAVEIFGRGVLILGSSGSGKSQLALDLMSRGARLIADDRTYLGRRGPALIAWSPSAIVGLIEGRGIGVMRAEAAPPTPLSLIVDLDHASEDRLPPRRTWSALEWEGPCIHGRGLAGLAPAVVQLLKGGGLSHE